MTSDFVKHRLQIKVAQSPRDGSNEPVLALCREFAEEAFVAGISMAFQEWADNHVSSTQRWTVRRYLAGRLPGIILNQYLPAQRLLDSVDLTNQLLKWTVSNPEWAKELEEAAFDESALCAVVDRLYYSLLEFSKQKRS